MLTNIVGAPHGASWEPTSGRRCRSCGTLIRARDGFGINESVCPACRGDAVELTGRASDRSGGGGRLAALGERASRSLAAFRRAA
jgi:hypothetical protein